MPDLESWSTVAVVNPKALDDQVESIGMVARELGPGVPVIQTVFSPITVAGYLVGKSKSRVVRELRKHPELVRPALDRIADVLVDFARRSVEAGAAGVFYAISGYASKDAMPEAVYRELVLPLDLSVLERLPQRGLVQRRAPVRLATCSSGCRATCRRRWSAGRSTTRATRRWPRAGRSAAGR